MRVDQAIILGLIEGLTEFLPISSTGHLIITERMIGIEEGIASDAFTICIQGGAVLAVILLYHARIWLALKGLVGRDVEGRRLVINLFMAFLPAGVLGLLFESRLKEHLFNTTSVAIALVVWGIVILIVERTRRNKGPLDGDRIELLKWKGALFIGLMQCFALWPGTSRSLVTILGGLAVGLNLAAAVEFSFLVGLIVLSAATMKDIMTDGLVMFRDFGVLSVSIGFITAAVSAAFAIKWMVSWLNRHSLVIFGWYRVLLGIILLVSCSNADSTSQEITEIVSDIQDVMTGDPGSSASCIVTENDIVISCSHFVNIDGDGMTSMQSAYTLCTSGPGQWMPGGCPLSSVTAECIQPGTKHFRQTDYCYGNTDVCSQTCLGEFITLQ